VLVAFNGVISSILNYNATLLGVDLLLLYVHECIVNCELPHFEAVVVV